MSVAEIIWAIGFFVMTGLAFKINRDWAMKCEELNRSWFETATHHNEEWGKICEKITYERDVLKAKLEEGTRNERA